MFFLGYFIMKKLSLDLADEVIDLGDSLKVKKNGKEISVPLSEVINVSYAPMMNPSRVTLKLRNKSPLGDEISFSAPLSFIPFKKNKDIEDLIDRIDQVK